MTSGSESKLPHTLNASENFKMGGQIFVQDNLRKKVLIKIMDPNLPVFSVVCNHPIYA